MNTGINYIDKKHTSYQDGDKIIASDSADGVVCQANRVQCQVLYMLTVAEGSDILTFRGRVSATRFG